MSESSNADAQRETELSPQVLYELTHLFREYLGSSIEELAAEAQAGYLLACVRASGDTPALDALPTKLCYQMILSEVKRLRLTPCLHRNGPCEAPPPGDDNYEEYAAWSKKHEACPWRRRNMP